MVDELFSEPVPCTGSCSLRDVGILIPGVYTLEADRGATIGARLVRPGQTVRPESGMVPILPETTPATIVLRGGSHLARLSIPPPEEPLFSGYYWRSR